MGNETEEYGVHRLQEVNVTQGNQTYDGTPLTEFEGVFQEIFTAHFGGTYELSGMLALVLIGYGLYKTDVSLDVSASIMIPMVSLLATGGFLPYGEGIMFGLLIAITGIGIFGLFKFAAR